MSIKNLVYFIFVFLFFIKIFSCSGQGGSCVSSELIPKGYRAEEYNNPVLKNAIQMRITDSTFTFFSKNFPKILKTVASKVYAGEDNEGNAKIKVCIPPTYGVQAGNEYGVASTCNHDSCDLCGVSSGSNGVLCEEESRCVDGSIGSDLEVILKNFKLEPIDEEGELDKIHVSLDLKLGDIPLWINPGTSANLGIFGDNNSKNVGCFIKNKKSISVSLDLDFFINNDLEEIDFDLNESIDISADNFDIECPNSGFFQFIFSMIKGIIINQAKPMIGKMIKKVKNTMLCNHCSPNRIKSVTNGFHCPITAPINTSCFIKNCNEEACENGYYCDEDGFCKKDISCTNNIECNGGECIEGVCISTPLCMKSEDECWKSKLGKEGRINIKDIISLFIDSKGESWLNYYINLAKYAKYKSKGMTLAMHGGTSYDFSPCVPKSNSDFSKQIPELSIFNSNQIDSLEYHFGLSISEYFMNQSLESFYNSGAMCLDINSGNNSLLSSSSLSMILPSINELVEENSSAAVSIRPLNPPMIRLGDGEVDDDGNPLLSKSLINIDIKDLKLDFYIFTELRYIRILTMTIDVTLGINLIVEDNNKIVPIIAPLKMGKSIKNLRITNNEILKENASDLENTFPAVISLALNSIPLNFISPPLPDLMGFKLDNINFKVLKEGEDEDTKRFFAIITKISLNENNTPSPLISNILLKSKTIPNISELKKGKIANLKLKIESKDKNILSQYRINDGLWRPFQEGNLLNINEDIFIFSGKYKIDIRIKKERNLSKVFTYYFVNDNIKPSIKINRTKNSIIISAFDNFSKKLKWNIKNDNYKVESDNRIIIDTKNKEYFELALSVEDEAGNKREVFKRFNFKNDKKINDLAVQSCSYGGKPSYLFFIFILLIFFKFFKKKLLAILFMLTLFIYSCDNPKSCFSRSDCDENYSCDNGECIACNRENKNYQCTSCYIEGRCTDDEGANPCKKGCSCNETLGICNEIVNYCDENKACKDESYKCVNNICEKKECLSIDDCLNHSCENNENSVYCEDNKCICKNPCGGSCNDGTFCCQDKENENYDKCITVPINCGEMTCDKGYTLKVIKEGEIDSATCMRKNVVCSCEALPELKMGTTGKFLKTLVWKDKVILLAYNSLYEDLVVGIYDENYDTRDKEHIKWTFLDGILNNGQEEAEVTANINGPRAGISQKGNNVGRYLSAVIDSQDRIHISYYDKTNGNLKYGLLKINKNDENFNFDFTPLTIDEDGDTGLYTSITLNKDSCPMIVYMANEYEKNYSYYSALRIAISKKQNPLNKGDWNIINIKEANKDLPCNKSCSDEEKCLYDPRLVETCNSEEKNKRYSNNKIKNILDNDSNGIISYINIPDDTRAKELVFNMDLAHKSIGDLKITLISPENREIVIANPSDINQENLKITDKYIYQFRNKIIKGLWSLSIVDTKAGKEGKLIYWDLNIVSNKNTSKYCGSVCLSQSNDCNNSCDSSKGKHCVNGICMKEAKELELKYKERAVGLYANSLNINDNLSISYLDSIDNKLKYIEYDYQNLNISKEVWIDSGDIQYPSLSNVDNVAYLSYKDGEGFLRYVKIDDRENMSSKLIDTGERINNDIYELNKVGTSSVFSKNSNNELEIYYMNETKHRIIKKTYSNNNWSIHKVLQNSLNNNNYLGSFGFYINIVFLKGKRLISSFYYKLNNNTTDMPGKVKIIKAN